MQNRTPEQRARALCDALARRVTQARTQAERQPYITLYAQATALWNRLLARDTPDPEPPLLPGASAPHPTRRRRQADGVHLSRLGGWDAIAGGRKVAAGAARLDAEAAYERAA